MSGRAREGAEPRPGRLRPLRTAGPAPIERPRLLGLLAERFERRLTVVHAPAGYGKSTVLAQAASAEAGSGRGRDVWVGLQPSDEDDDLLAADLLAALGRGPDGGRSAQAVADAVWALAPQEVALVLDDLHHVVEHSPGAALVAELVDALPANGHLVLGTRTPPPFPLARRRATGELLELGEAELAFDAEELARFADQRGVDIAVVDRCAGWPALAEFQTRVGAESGEAPWEALLADVDGERVEALARLALFAELDDELVGVVTGLDATAAELVEGLPLVTVGGGQVHLHDLWRDALVDRRPAGPDDGVRAGAALLQERGRAREGFDALQRAGDEDAFGPFVAAFARTDFPESSTEDLRHILKGLPAALASQGHGALLRGAVLLGEDGAAALAALVEASELLAASGDHEGEAVALVRRIMIHFWQDDVAAMRPVVERLRVLAGQGVARAQRSIALSEAYGLLVSGHPGEAMRQVGRAGAHRDPSTAGLAGFLVATASLDQGHPARTLREIATTLPGSTGRVRAALLGLRIEAHAIEALPDEATHRGRRQELEEALAELGVVETSVQASAAMALVELRLGHEEDAQDLVATARLDLGSLVGPRARIAVGVAEAALHREAGDRDAAAARLAELVAEVPVGSRPDRAYLRAAPLVHSLVPAVRPVLDDLVLGPVWAAGVAAGRALVAAREDDPAPAARLFWHRPGELRALTLPVEVIELAVAALAAGNDAARPVLDTLPVDVRRVLKDLASGSGLLADQAQALLGEVAGPPDQPIGIQVLGPFALRRGDEAVTGGGWRRERVRDLLAHLVARRSWTRLELATALWPELDERSGLNNLRVNLNHLQQVLEPDRDREDPPWFIRSTGDAVALVPSDHLEVDADRFAAEVEAARAADARGVPAQALEHHLRAVERYRGDYLEGHDGLAGVAFERLRLRGAFVASAVRAGELLLGSGRAEDALALARRAVEAESMDEAAHRLQAQAAATLGDHRAAVAALEAAVDLVQAAGLTPEHATRRLLVDLGAGGPA